MLIETITWEVQVHDPDYPKEDWQWVTVGICTAVDEAAAMFQDCARGTDRRVRARKIVRRYDTNSGHVEQSEEVTFDGETWFTEYDLNTYHYIVGTLERARGSLHTAAAKAATLPPEAFHGFDVVPEIIERLDDLVTDAKSVVS